MGGIYLKRLVAHYVGNNPVNYIDPTGHVRQRCESGSCDKTDGVPIDPNAPPADPVKVMGQFFGTIAAGAIIWEAGPFILLAGAEYLLANPDVAVELGYDTAAAVTDWVSPTSLRFSQNTAGGNGRADVLRDSMSQNGWNGPPVDVVATADGLTTIDNTRVAIALEQGISEIPVTIHQPGDSLPDGMIGRFGDAKSWGEAILYWTRNQRPPLGPTGTPTPPRLPRRR